ncbi:MAG: hypothetical protein HQ580_07415 [Planctomycetes bacterium]|nr:hypothetical protein [Planctomycetota bacterium]
MRLGRALRHFDKAQCRQARQAVENLELRRGVCPADCVRDGKRPLRNNTPLPEELLFNVAS